MNPQKEETRIYRIDKFKIPAAAKEEFLSRVRTSNEILRTIPGFVEDRFFEQLGASGDSKIVTIAVWENERAFSNAKLFVEERYKKIGFHPGDIIKRLGIQADMDAYIKVEL